MRFLFGAVRTVVLNGLLIKWDTVENHLQDIHTEKNEQSINGSI
jgi:hypothetical protein